MGIGIKKSTLAKGFLVFFAISVAIMVGILVWTTERATWLRLAQFKWNFIPVLIGLGIIRWFLDGMAFVTMAKHGSSSSLGVGRAAIIRLEGSLVAIVIPVLLGTFSMHAYLLRKEKMTISESVAITVIRGILPIFIFLLNIPILFLIRNNPESGKFFAQFVKVISLPLGVILLFFVITLFYPHTMKRGASAFIRWWGKRVRFLHFEKILKIEERLFHEIDQFSEIFWTYLRKKKHMFFRAAGWIFVAFTADSFIALAILWGFGFHPPLIRGLAVQFLIRSIIFLAPTPGGAGILEFTYLGFFSMFMPNYLIGVAVLIWRLLLTYLPSMAAIFFLTKEFQKDKWLRQTLLEKGVLPEESMRGVNSEDKDLNKTR